MTEGKLTQRTRAYARLTARDRLCLVAGLIGVVLLGASVGNATPGYTYPTADSPAVNDQVIPWQNAIPASVAKTKCGNVAITGGGSEQWRTPDSTPQGRNYRPLSQHRLYTGLAGQLAGKKGGDTNVNSPEDIDQYAMLRLVGIRANLFFKLYMEVEDGKKLNFSLRYIGEEFVYISNPPVGPEATSMVITDYTSMSYARDVLNFDGMFTGNYNKKKELRQEFHAVCICIDGTHEVLGAKTVYLSPSTTTKAVSKKFGGSFKFGKDKDGKHWEVGLEGAGGSDEGYTAESFSQLDLDDKEDSLGPVAHIATGGVPCPFDQVYPIQTLFNGQFVASSKESADDGCRQELTYEIHHWIVSVVITGCAPCSGGGPPPPPPPEDAVTPGAPTTPSPTTPPPTTTPNAGPPREPKQKKRDVDGDGNPEGASLGGPRDSNRIWGDGAPYFLRVLQREATDEYWTSLDRWDIGSVNDNMTSALIDPWHVQDGTRALVVMTDMTTGTCSLVEVARGALQATGTEEWPDREEEVARRDYAASALQSVNLDALVTPDVVAAYLTETFDEATAEWTVTLELLTVESIYDEVHDEDKDVLVPGAEYTVERNATTGAIELTEVDD